MLEILPGEPVVVEVEQTSGQQVALVDKVWELHILRHKNGAVHNFHHNDQS